MSGHDGASFLVCLVSDGAGSARFAAQGSALACSAAMASIEATLQSGETLCRDKAVGWLETVRSAIQAAADKAQGASRDYACTLLGAVVGERNALFFQIGDGAIVVTNPAARGVVFWPEEGPYVNMTHFVTDEDALTNLEVVAAPMQVEEVALFSDGLQRLALSFESRMPHHPFFDPMFAVLRGKRLEDCEELCDHLAKFLSSAPINERTDDDKTLVMATRGTA
ncbi:protein phosphatase 2C domain-containing protein [Paraburkholderia sp. RG36]|uniref:Protein phosphatase 2C domain-containing protein n=1 Tax=Paraburkholderia tagetis TaxID=2913261 RepID=A0A9X1ULC3_9BURK|nr:protein phosphatase 2C domain-containing protein [Paraburkholderia tagetis]